MLDSLAYRRGVTFRKRFLRPYLFARTDSAALVKPLTFMNRSGDIFPDALRRLDATIERLVVVCDNMDLPPGSIRLKRSGRNRAHNGISSIMNALGSGDFARLYVGVGRPEASSDIVDHVLSAPDSGEMEAYSHGLAAAADVAERLLSEPLEQVIAQGGRG